MTRKEWPIMWVLCFISHFGGISRQSHGSVRGDAFKMEDVEKYGAETPRCFFLWSLITGPCMPMIFERAIIFFLCFGLYPRTWGPTCQLPWFGSPWFDEKIIRSCTWALAWTPFILGYLDRQLGTCQRSAGSLGIRLSGAQIFHNFSFSQV